LGAKVTPIICTDKNGINKIKSILKKPNLDLSHIKIKDRASITTSIELLEDNQKINIMLRDLGDLENFSPLDLNEKDENVIKKADYVCIFNWAGTKNYGSELAKKIFLMVKKTGNGKTYYDTADPNSNKKKIPELIEGVLKSNFLDILSLNENEAITYASTIDVNIQKRKKSKRIDNLSLEAARVLADKLNSRIDLHTSKFAATITKKKEVLVPTFKINPCRTTGAGDSWNAGNILGDMNCLSNQSRLIIANAVSACYLLNPKGEYPTKKTLLRFIKKEFNNNSEIKYQSPIF
jgi:sugar/nucleoside kinase (ribokinase family)